MLFINTSLTLTSHDSLAFCFITGLKVSIFELRGQENWKGEVRSHGPRECGAGPRLL